MAADEAERAGRSGDGQVVDLRGLARRMEKALETVRGLGGAGLKLLIAGRSMQTARLEAMGCAGVQVCGCAVWGLARWWW